MAATMEPAMAAMEAAMPMESAMEGSMKPAMEDAFMPEMVESIAEEEESTCEEGRSEPPGICPIVLVGVWSDVDHLRRQRVDLRR